MKQNLISFLNNLNEHNMCNTSSSKNQTSKDVFEFIAQPDKLNGLGIGYFVVPAPDLGIMEYRSILVEGITYKETVKRGHNCEAFKFFPVGITMNSEKGSIVINTKEDIKDLK